MEKNLQPKRRHAFQWHITHRCNLRCAHCYQTDYQEQTPQKELYGTLDKYVGFLGRTGCAGHIFLTGGEPLVHPDFYDLIEEIARRGLRLTVMTNGTLIDEASARRIAAVRPDCLQISLDGTKKFHDGIRGEGSFDRALHGADLLTAAGVPVIVSFTAQKSNRGELPALAKICAEHKLHKLRRDRVVTEEPEDTARLALTGRQFEKLVRTAGRLHKKIKKPDGRPLVSCERSLQFLGCPDERCGYVCKAGGDMIVVLADGSVMPCRRLPFVIGNIKDGEFDELIAAAPVMRLLKTEPPPEDCLGCPHLPR